MKNKKDNPFGLKSFKSSGSDEIREYKSSDGTIVRQYYRKDEVKPYKTESSKDDSKANMVNAILKNNKKVKETKELFEDTINKLGIDPRKKEIAENINNLMKDNNAIYPYAFDKKTTIVPVSNRELKVEYDDGSISSDSPNFSAITSKEYKNIKNDNESIFPPPPEEFDIKPIENFKRKIKLEKVDYEEE